MTLKTEYELVRARSAPEPARQLQAVPQMRRL